MYDVPRTNGKHLECAEVWGGNQSVDESVTLPGLDAWVFSRPCGHGAGGGDVHYLSACSGGQLVRILVADVSGHGPPVADVANGLRQLMRRLVNERDQQRLVGDLNREFISLASAARIAAEPRSAPFRFATAVALTFDRDTNRLLTVNAGHPPPLWFRAARGSWTTLEPAVLRGCLNLPVGIIEGMTYEQFGVTLEAGDLVLCYTDSLIEARDARGDMIGIGGLLDLVRDVATDDPARLVPDVISVMDRWNAFNITQDDMTCLLISVTGNGLVPVQ